MQDALQAKYTHADVGYLKVFADGEGESFAHVPYMLQGDSVVLQASPSSALLVKEMTIEGQRRMPAARALSGVVSELEKKMKVEKKG